MNRTSPPPDLDADSLLNAVEWAIASRRSIRAFRPTPVPRTTIERILHVARYAASGVNIQPWQVHVLTGAALDRLRTAIRQVDDDPQLAAEHADEWDYYPREWISPFIDRRRKLGWKLYGLLGIEKGDKPAMHAQHGRNYRFFDAPVGLMFTMHRIMQRGSLLDYGMFLQNIMIAARAHGLDSCPQAAFMKYHKLIARELALPDDQIFICGMSLGYADHERVENQLVSEREEVETFTRFLSD